MAARKDIFRSLSSSAMRRCSLFFDKRASDHHVLIGSMYKKHVMLILPGTFVLESACVGFWQTFLVNLSL